MMENFPSVLLLFVLVGLLVTSQGFGNLNQVPRSPAWTLKDDAVRVGRLLTLITVVPAPLFTAVSKSAAATPEITSLAFLDIAIANYTDESVGTNRPARGSGRIVVGLYGKDAPRSVSLFLKTLTANGVDFPNYLNAQFLKIGQDDGLLEIEKVRGLKRIQLAGSDAFEFDGQIMTEMNKPLIEKNALLHDRPGLLTRSTLSSTPEFSITTKAAAALDSFHCVFGEIVNGMQVLDAVMSIPRYSYEAATGYTSALKGTGLEQGFAESWFKSQKSFYVGAGKAFGDQRAVDQRGKLLRRVTIKGGGLE